MNKPDVNERPAGLYYEELEPGLVIQHRIRRTVRLSKSRANAGIITFEHRAFNQRNELVAKCRRVALMQRKFTGDNTLSERP
jgi:hypothetical protein